MALTIVNTQRLKSASIGRFFPRSLDALMITYRLLISFSADISRMFADVGIIFIQTRSYKDTQLHNQSDPATETKINRVTAVAKAIQRGAPMGVASARIRRIPALAPRINLKIVDVLRLSRF